MLAFNLPCPGNNLCMPGPGCAGHECDYHMPSSYVEYECEGPRGPKAPPTPSCNNLTKECSSCVKRSPDGEYVQHPGEGRPCSGPGDED